MLRKKAPTEEKKIPTSINDGDEKQQQESPPNPPSKKSWFGKSKKEENVSPPPPTEEEKNGINQQPPPRKSWFRSKPQEVKEPEPKWPWINEEEWLVAEKVSNRLLRLYGGASGNKFQLDDKIEINYKSRGTWYPGKITNVRGHNIYDVKYNDKPPPKKSWFTKPPPKNETIEESKIPDIEESNNDDSAEISEESGDESGNEIIEESGEESGDESGDEIIEESAEESGDELVESSGEESGEELVESSGEESGGEESGGEKGNLDEILGADSGDEAEIENDPEEDEKFVQHCKAKLTENYQVARWIKQGELKKKIKLIREIQDQKDANDKLKKQWFGKSDAIAVENYWDEEASIKATMSSRAIRGLHVIQVVWRYWLELKRLRVARKVSSGGADLIIYVQNALRTWEARQKALALRGDRMEKIRQFKEFCVAMKEGVTLITFSRKYGGSGPRLVKFSDDYNELTYVCGFMNTRKIELKTIYRVGEGVSGYKYPNAHPTRTAWCFHLELIGDKYLDFECFSKQQAHLMVHGFRRLRHLFYTNAPFYFDALGIPRRAGPSIIEMGLKGGGRVESLSNADEMRYRQALRCLNEEYNNWFKEYDTEKTAWEESLNSVFDKGKANDKEEQAGENGNGKTVAETVAATEITEDIGGEGTVAGSIKGSDKMIVENTSNTNTDPQPKKRFWNILKFGSRLKREPKKEPDGVEKLDKYVDANKISVADLEAILDKKRAESAANSGDEESGSEYEEIEVTDSEEEVEEEEVEVEEEEVEEEEEEESPPVVETTADETPADATRKVLPLHPNLPRSAPSDRNRYTSSKEIRYTPM